MSLPLVSYIIPVYNKSHAIRATLQSLLNQQGEFTAEFIFVDDASSDDSVKILGQCHDSRVRVIENNTNCGPAIRLNQGAQAARGVYLQFVDADDIISRGATNAMLGILLKEHADFIYGKWRLSGLAPEELLGAEVHGDEAYQVSDQPLRYVLTHKNIVRMVLMTTKSCFKACGGCDEKVFVQDESLPLRLAWKAERFVDYSAAVIQVPAQDGRNLSGNKVQQHHDGFVVFFNALRDLDGLDEACRRLLYKRAVSIAWKHYRRNMNGTVFSNVTAYYLRSRLPLIHPSENVLKTLYALFDGFHDRIRLPGAAGMINEDL